MARENEPLAARLALHYDAPSYRRVIAGKDVIIHCHHYNSRIQRTVEGAADIDGRGLIHGAAETVFDDHVGRALREGDDAATRLAMVEELYAHLGFGRVDLGRLADGEVTASASHFASVGHKPREGETPAEVDAAEVHALDLLESAEALAAPCP